MGLFGKWRQQERTPPKEEHAPPKEETIDIEKAMAAIGARQAFLEALTLHLVGELPPKKRDSLLEQLQKYVRGLIRLPPPVYVPPHRREDFQDELRRAMQILVEKTTRPKSTS